MVPMFVAVFLVIVLVVGGLVVVLLRRPSSEDLHSVRKYHSALGTLEHLSGRAGSPAARLTTRPDRPGAEGVLPPVPVRGSEHVPDPGTQVVFDASLPARQLPGGEGTSGSRADRAQRIALDSMNHRRRPGSVVLMVAAVLLLFGVLAYVGSHRSKPSSDHATTTTDTIRSTSRSGTGHSGRTTGPRSGTHTGRPPATTLPARLVATTTSASGTSATYTVPFASFTITLNASGLCWVQATTVATQATLWSGELTVGGVQKIAATGATALELGAPPVTLSVDAIPVVLPTPLHTPFIATFTPPPAGSAPSVTSPSTTSPSTTVPSNTTASSTAAFIVPSDSTASDSTASDTTASMTTAVIGSSPGSPVSAAAPSSRAVRLERLSRTRLWGRGSATRLRDRVRRG